MEIFRPLIGFVLGLAVTTAAYVAGFLEGIPHWSHSHSHWISGPGSTDPEQVRYKVSADFQSDDGSMDSESCTPRFEFHNRTNHSVVFSSDGYDDIYRGMSNAKSDQGAISLTPDQDIYGPPAKGSGKDSYGSNTFGARDSGSRDFGSQDFSSTDYGSADYGSAGYGGSDYGGSDGSSYGSQNASYGQDYGGRNDNYDDEYPGPSGDACNGGVVEISLDRKN